MRLSSLLAAPLALCLVSGAAAAPEPPTALRAITAIQKSERDYAEGLKDLHLGRLEQALDHFRDAAKRDPHCAMAWWGQSRVHYRARRMAEAAEAVAKAEEAARFTEDREQKMIAAWAKWVKAPTTQAEMDKARNEVRRDLDNALCIYSDDPELWLLRAETSVSPLRANPYYQTAFRIQPSHPLAASWKPVVQPLPELTPSATSPVAAISEAPTLFQGLGDLTHPITTKVPECQAFYEQGLRTFHSYVSPMPVKNSGARNFQHAANLDPEAPMPYWGLSFCVRNNDVMKPLDAANRALELALKGGTDKEKRFAAARVLQLSNKREEFQDALDSAIGAYPDDVELMIWRGTDMANARDTSQNNWPAAIVYQQAAHRLRPEHPAPNHEMVHGYEAIDRPALGWPYTEGYRKAGPNMPHANHMQAHLAMRLGRWQEAIDCTRASRRKSLEGFPELDPSHHIDILMRALAHEGRFQEADSEPRAYRDGLPWARLLQLKADPEALSAWAEKRRERNAPDGFYIGALAALDRGDLPAAATLMTRVEEDWKKNQNAAFQIYRYNEVKGRYLVQTGQVDEGLKLLREAGARAVKDTGLHAWGGGSYMLEAWGVAAIQARKWDEAEEAFHEALAHERGSIIGALGMQVVWENRGNAAMARHYADRATAIWKDADPGVAERHLARLRSLGSAPVAINGGLK